LIKGLKMDTIAALFMDFENANTAIEKLQASGFTPDSISVVARDTALAERLGGDPEVKDVASRAGVGALSGGVGGGLLGLLVGIGALAIPGIGPVFAAGSMAAALGLTAGGAGVGAAVGGILGAMTGLSITDEDAQVFAEGVKRGGILVVVQATEIRADEVRDIFRDADAKDVNTLRENWRQEGWTGFEERDDPRGWRDDS
jgi:hypothetical protein